METRNKHIFPKPKEYSPMAHKLETPHEMYLALIESAERVGSSDQEKLIDSLAIFKQNVVNFMNQFDITTEDFVSGMDNKRVSAGGFRKRAVQEHSYLGEQGLRLVRDRRSKEFLKPDQDDFFYRLLVRKLEEETRELAEAMNGGERREELGDVFEVFNTILEVRGISASLIEGKRQINELNARKEKKRKLAKKK